jgi:predicted ATPase
MLREIRVSGFKSLVDFDLNIRPGINVLVGPNGAGKTNIIRLFEFLSYLQRSTLSEAVSNAGGAGEIFRKKDSTTIERVISIRLRGHGWILDELSFTGDDEPEEKYMAYELSMLIQSSEADNQLYYANQQLKVKEYAQAPKQILF